MLLEPEHEKYTTTLTIDYADPTRPEEAYVFLPALRRYQPLAPSARCVKTAGTDGTRDDYEFGFDSNITRLKVDYLGHRRILTLADVKLPGAPFPAGFEMPYGWPEPSMGKWAVKDVEEIAVSGLPGLGNAASCFGRRILYIDSHFYTPLWVENYDTQMHLLRIHAIFPHTVDAPGIGPVNASGADVETFWNLPEQHATFTVEPDGNGQHYINEQTPAEYKDVPRYSSPAGLNLIMR
jgi:hypothetical protein